MTTKEPTFKESTEGCVGCIYWEHPSDNNEDCLNHPCMAGSRDDNKTGIYVYPEVQTEEGK